MSESEKKNLTALVWMRCPSKYNGTHLVALLKVAGLSVKYGKANIRVPVLAAMCGVSERAMQKTLKRLRKDGLLTVKHRKCKSSHLTLNIEEIEKLPLVNPNPDNQQEQTEPVPEPVAEQPKAEAAKPAPEPVVMMKPEPVARPWDEQPAAVEGNVVYGLQGFHAVGWPDMKNLLSHPTKLKECTCTMWQVHGADVKHYSVTVERNGRGFTVMMPSGQVLEAA